MLLRNVTFVKCQQYNINGQVTITDKKELLEKKKHQEKDPSEGGTGNVPDIPDGMLFQCDCIVTVH